MKITNIAISLLLIGLVVSCGGSHDHDQVEAKTDNVAEKLQVVGASTTLAEIKIGLNNGTKWDSDESTFAGMKRLELTLYNFSEDFSEPTIADYNKLGEALANIDKDIISQCSMQGEDHDQLHLLLTPMLHYVNEIKNGVNTHDAKINMEALNKAIAQFFKHFEVK
jgi:hypothetical protein